MLPFIEKIIIFKYIMKSERERKRANKGFWDLFIAITLFKKYLSKE